MNLVKGDMFLPRYRVHTSTVSELPSSSCSHI